jgi:hypothetical protein
MGQQECLSCYRRGVRGGCGLSRASRADGVSMSSNIVALTMSWSDFNLGEANFCSKT